MKRSLIALVSFVVLALAQTALAQDIPVKNKPVVGLIAAIGVGLPDTKVVYDQAIPTTLTWSGQIDPSDPEGSIATVLEPTGFASRRIDQEIHIYRVGTTASASPQPNDTADARRAMIDNLMAKYPNVIRSDGSFGSFRQFNQMTEEIVAAQADDRRALIESQLTRAETSTSGGSIGGAVDPRNQLIYDRFGIPRFINLLYRSESLALQHIWGSAKVHFKGRKNLKDEAFLEHVSVVALVRKTDGTTAQYVIIDAAEGNNRWDADVTVPIASDGSVTLLFVNENGTSQPPAFGRNLWLEPQAIRRNATPVMLQEEQFRHARDQYDLRQHRFIENETGDIVKAVEK